MDNLIPHNFFFSDEDLHVIFDIEGIRFHEKEDRTWVSQIRQHLESGYNLAVLQYVAYQIVTKNCLSAMIVENPTTKVETRYWSRPEKLDSFILELPAEVFTVELVNKALVHSHGRWPKISKEVVISRLREIAEQPDLPEAWIYKIVTGETWPFD